MKVLVVVVVDWSFHISFQMVTLIGAKRNQVTEKSEPNGC